MKTLVFALCAVFVVFTGTAFAAPLFYEGFNYDAGSTAGPEGGWTTVSGSNGFDVVAGAGYTDDGGNVLQVSGGAAYSINDTVHANNITMDLSQPVRDLFAQNGTFYVSFLIKEYLGLQFAARPTQSNLILVNAGSGLMTTDYYKLNGEVQLNAWPNNQHDEVSTGPGMYWNGNTWAFWSMRFVMRDGTDEITIIRNQNLLAPDWDNITNRGVRLSKFDITTADFSLLRLTSGGAVDPSWWQGSGPEWVGGVDEIRIGTSWGDVAPVPEPSSILALAMGAAGFGGFALRRRRA